MDKGRAASRSRSRSPKSLPSPKTKTRSKHNSTLSTSDKVAQTTRAPPAGETSPNGGKFEDLRKVNLSRDEAIVLDAPSGNFRTYTDTNCGILPGKWYPNLTVAFADDLIGSTTGKVTFSWGKVFAVVLAIGTETQIIGPKSQVRVLSPDRMLPRAATGLSNVNWPPPHQEEEDQCVRRGEIRSKWTLENLPLRTVRQYLMLGPGKEQNRVRVLRSEGLNSPWAPTHGVRFDGLYTFGNFTCGPNKNVDTHMTVSFTLTRCAHQCSFDEILLHPTSRELELWSGFSQELEDINKAQRERNTTGLGRN